MQDVKAEGSSYDDLLKRIEALEAKGAGGNVTAPDIMGLKIGFEIRHRFEMKEDFITNNGPVVQGAYVKPGSKGPVGRRVIAPQTAVGITNFAQAEDSEFVLQRTRIYLDADINKNVRGYVNLQDTRHFGEEGSTIGDLNRTDLLEGYAELRNLGDLNPILNNVGLRVGRWQMAYGDDRLIGTLNWANEGRSYDGARMRWDNKKNAWIDVFAAIISEKGTNANGQFGGAAGNTVESVWGMDEVLYGVYSQFKFYAGNLVEPYLLVRARSAENTQPPTDTATGNTGEQRYTAGFRLDGRKIPGLGGFDYTIEPAWQFGKVEGLRIGDYSEKMPAAGVASNESNVIQAFGIYAGAGYTFDTTPWTPRIGYAFVYASGDEDPNTGATKTFDHLYPTGHAHLGYIDFAAWQNIEDHQVHFNIKPTKKLVFDAKLHFFELDEEADAWYGVAGGTGFGGGMNTIRGGADFYTGKNGMLYSVDDDLGEELDITMNYNMFKNFGVVAGYSHFWAGDFVEDTAGDSDEDSNWAYLQTILKF